MGDVNELKKERNKTMANLPGSIKNLNTLLGEQLLEGGGSSDFSTANVDVTVNGEETFYIASAIGVFDGNLQWIDGFETATYTIVLYKGLLNGSISTISGYKISSATGTGGVTISTTSFGGKAVNITGDGTLTVDITRA